MVGNIMCLFTYQHYRLFWGLVEVMKVNIWCATKFGALLFFMESTPTHIWEMGSMIVTNLFWIFSRVLSVSTSLVLFCSDHVSL